MRYNYILQLFGVRGKYLTKIIMSMNVKKIPILYYALSNILIFITIVLQPFLYRYLVDEVLLKHNVVKLLQILVAYMLLFICGGVFTYLKKKSSRIILIETRTLARKKLISDFSETKTKDELSQGEKKNRLDADTLSVHNFLINQFVDYYITIVFVLIMLVIMIIYSFKLFIISVLMLVFSVIISKRNSKKYNELTREFRNTNAQYDGFLIETFNFWKVIRIENIMSLKEREFKEFWTKLSNIFQRRQLLWYINNVIVSFNNLFVNKLMLYFAGGILVIKGDISIGILLSFMAYYENLNKDITKITNKIVTLSDETVSLDRILDEKVLGNAEEEIKTINKVAIEVDNISFSYDNESSILQGLCLILRQGEHIMISGNSGCGKTTLADLLMGEIEVEHGSILIHNRNPYTLSAKNRSELIGYLSQTPKFFEVTILDNIKLGKKNITDEEVINICKEIGIHTKIMKQELGYYTVLKEDKKIFSGGERKLIAIARLILLNSPIIILDELTSNLSKDKINDMLNLISKKYRNRTVIHISHNSIVRKFVNKEYELSDKKLNVIL